MLKYYFFCLSFFYSVFSYGQITQSLFDIIDEKASEGIIVHGNVQEIISNEHDDITTKGTIQFKSTKGGDLNLPIDIELRGRFRRIRCDFPPMKFQLKRKNARFHSIDEKYRSIRLVTHCYTDDDGGFDQLEREYLIYKMYQMVSPHAYRVKKVNIEYRDSINNTSETFTAILLEDNDQLAFRLGAFECENVYNLDEALLDEANHLQVSGFEFMVANSDWSKSKLKNIRLFKRGASYVLIPYDFDFAGMAGSKLAKPNNNLGLFRMKDRCWVGPDMTSNQALLDIFEPLEDSFRELIADAPALGRNSKKEMLDLIESFYVILRADPLQYLEVYENSKY